MNLPHPVTDADYHPYKQEFGLEPNFDHNWGFLYFASRAIEAEKEAREAHQEARIDKLTGLLSRSAFEQIAKHKLAEAKREGHQLGLLFLDLDKFKGINDNHGHTIGDVVLAEVGSVLNDTLRTQVKGNEGDIFGGPFTAARLGGDEILVLCDITPRRIRGKEGSPQRRLDRVGERVTQAIAGVGEKLQDKYPELAQINLGVSIGAQLWEPDMTLRELVDGGDKKMYQNKRAPDKQRSA